MRKRTFAFDCLTPRVLACDGCGADCAEIGPADPAMVNPMDDPAPDLDPAIEGASMSPPIEPEPPDFDGENPAYVPLPPLPVGPAGPAF